MYSGISSATMESSDLLARHTRRSTRLSHALITNHLFGVDFKTTKATISRTNMEELQEIGDSTVHARKDDSSIVDRNYE